VNDKSAKKMLRQRQFHLLNMLKSAGSGKKMDLTVWHLTQVATMILLNIKPKSTFFV
jgi:hypothetical protein